MTWILQTAIAHRGLHNGSSRPENSLSAFEFAIQHNIPIELDIHQLSDGNLAVFHDPELSRMTGMPGTLAAQNASTLKPFKLLETDQSIPLIDEVLALVAGNVPILIEIKQQDRVGPLEQTLHDKLAHYAGDYAIQSFNPASVAWFKHHAPHILRGQLLGSINAKTTPWPTDLLHKTLLINGVSSPHFIAYNLHGLPSLPVAIARRFLHIPILAWTIQTEQDKAKALKYADNIIFEAIAP